MFDQVNESMNYLCIYVCIWTLHCGYQISSKIKRVKKKVIFSVLSDFGRLSPEEV